MSGLAAILLSEGFEVSGSDMNETALARKLGEQGAGVYIGHKAEQVEGADVVVYTAAIRLSDNPEYLRAKELGLPILSRAELLGELMRNYREAVNISGTHGKTTTTSMITQILMEADKDPTVTVGGMLSCIGGNIRIGGPDYFVAEACEYTDSFLSFFPTIGIILNVEADHLDYFSSLPAIRESFRRFAMRLPQNEKGFLIINHDIEDIDFFLKDLKCPYVTFGKTDEADYTAAELDFDLYARPEYTLVVRGEEQGRIRLGVAGEHNVYNSLAAIAVADRLGIDRDVCRRALSRFTGTDRRFEYKGSLGGCSIIDDYAHHPQEIEATLKAAKRYPHNRLFVVFQPHTYSRTVAFMDDFADALMAADRLILADIYAAREKNTFGVSSADLADRINEKGGNAVYLDSFEKIKSLIRDEVQDGDLLITMGAGNVVEIGNQLLSE